MKLRCNEPLSKVAFKFKLRRYTLMSKSFWQQQLLEYYSSSKFNGYKSLTVIRDYFGKAVQVDPMKPMLKAPGITRLKL